MSYLLQNKTQRYPRRWRALILVVFLFFLIFGLDYWRPTLFPNIFYSIGRPLWGVGTVSGEFLQNILSIFKSKQSLDAENRQLRKSYGEAEARLLSRDILAKENEELRALLGRFPESRKSVLATVLTTPDFSPYDTFIIDAGSDFGVKVGDIVVASSTIALGEIEGVYLHYSKVKILSSPQKEFSVVVGSSGLQKNILGKGAGNFEMTVPRDFEVVLGSPVTLPGQDHLIVAIAESSEINETDALKKVLYKIPMNTRDIHFVEIVTAPLSQEGL